MPRTPWREITIGNPMKAKNMRRTAGFSRCGQYRYWLGREWDATIESCVFIGLNPSTADAAQDDPTIRRIMGFAQSWGYGGVVVINLFACRATYPTDLKQAIDPVGPRNNYWLRRICREAPLVIAAWGNDGQHRKRDHWARGALGELHCLGITKIGQPRHPLYVRSEAKPIGWHPCIP